MFYRQKYSTDSDYILYSALHNSISLGECYLAFFRRKIFITWSWKLLAPSCTVHVTVEIDVRYDLHNSSRNTTFLLHFSVRRMFKQIKKKILILSNPIFLPPAYSPTLIYFGRERGRWVTCNYPTVLKEKNRNRTRKSTTCAICWLKSVLHEETCREQENHNVDAFPHVVRI
jgi:hypothetical protein